MTTVMASRAHITWARRSKLPGSIRMRVNVSRLPGFKSAISITLG